MNIDQFTQFLQTESIDYAVSEIGTDFLGYEEHNFAPVVSVVRYKNTSDQDTIVVVSDEDHKVVAVNGKLV